MESNELTRELDRAAAAPFVDYPETPWWYPFLMGGYFTACLACFLLNQNGHTALGFGLLAVAIIAFGLWFRWYRAKWGTWPKMSEAPPEIKRAYTSALIGFVVLVPFVVAVAWFMPMGVALVATFAATTAYFWSYERQVYPAAVQKVRARLA